MINFKNKEKGILSKILLREFPSLSYSELKVLFRKKDVKVDGKRVNTDIKLNGNEEIIVYNKDKKVNIVYEDDNVAIAHKPIGVETTTVDKTFSQDSLEEITGYYACHRLDMNTEGLVILAKNKEVQKIIYNEFRLGNVHKNYVALVKGADLKDSDTLNHYLIKKDDKVVVIRDKEKDALEIITKYRVVERKDEISIVDIELLTGRTHQIRAHFAYISHPVVGDNKYGDKDFNNKLGYKKQCLCAYRLHFTFEDDRLKYLNDKVVETVPTFKIPS